MAKRDAAEIAENWRENPRWDDVVRAYSPEDVVRLSGSLPARHTAAEHGAAKLWTMLHTESSVSALGAVTGNQAIQQVRAGLKAIYVSGAQVAADGNAAGEVYPDRALHPSSSVPVVVDRIQRALRRADEIAVSEGRSDIDWFVPLVADGEAGFGSPLNAFETTKAMIDAGAAAVHFEDQLASEKRSGRAADRVLVPTSAFLRTLTAARLAADVLDVATLIIARTDAAGARLVSTDVDERDDRFLTGERTSEGFYRWRGGLEAAIARAIACAPWADLLWYETAEPNLFEARRFADAVHGRFPGKLLAYDCSPSFHWERQLDASTVAKFQRELAAMGYRLQFVTLAGFHSLNHGMFELARQYRIEGMTAYSRLQEAEIASQPSGYTAVRGQPEVGAGYFDRVAEVIARGGSARVAHGSSDEARSRRPPPA